jgi:PAS domain S-box-containing protein
MIQSLPFACALHRFVIDEQGIPCDYIFIEVNHLFEEYTGLTASNIIGKRVTEVIPGIKNDAFNWIETYARVTYSGEKMEFHQYSEALQKWYSVNAYSPAEHYFITIIEDITEKKALAQQAFSSEKTICGKSLWISITCCFRQQSFLDYALHRALELTESQYGYIYFYNEDLQQFELNTWTIGVLSDCEVIDKKTVYQLEKTGFWGEAVRQRKPIVNNNFASHHPLKKGFPEGHVR